MPLTLRTIGTAGLAAVAATWLSAVDAAGQRQARRALTDVDSVTTAVMVDVVVRDNRGRPVTDLTAADFELREDGALQQIGTFTRVARGTGIGVAVGLKDSNTTLVGAPSGVNADASSEPAIPTVTALVFDSLSATALALCQRAALDYLPRSTSAENRVGVFTTDPVIRMVQNYTDHPALVRQGVQAVLPAGSTAREQNAEPLAQARQRRDTLETQSAAAASATGAALGTSAGNIGQLEMDRRVVAGQLRMMNAFEALDRDQRGLVTSGALFGVLQTLVEVPGRKTLLLFSEGLPASPTLQVHLQSVIESANRLNVTVYAVDANGLQAVSSLSDSRREIEEAGQARLQQLNLLRDDADEPLTRALERSEDLLRLDSQTGLAALARGTGGFLVRDTNNLGDAFRRIDEDQRFHYLLTYTPGNQTLDGRFRRIGVRVRRPGVRVFARDGYRALRVLPSMPVRERDVPALAALDAPTLPTDVHFGTAALTFPRADGTSVVAVLVRLATGALAFDEDAARNAYRADATVVVRLTDASGAIAEQLSQEYQLSGALSDVAAARQGEILFFRTPAVMPGVYTVEAAVHDSVGGRIGARVSTVTVEGGSPGPRLSSVVLVRRSERVEPGGPDDGNPLRVGDVLLYPSTGENWSRSRDRELAFYVTARPRKSTGDKLHAEVAVRRGGRLLARVPTTLEPPASEDGSVRHLGRVALEPFDPGLYELSVAVRDASGRQEQSTFFTVVE